MEQQAEHQTEQRQKEHRVIGRPFQPGRSGNPRGRASVKDRIRAEAERLTHEFARKFGRAPDAFEADTIGNAALLRERLNKCSLADDESLVRLSNAHGRCMQRLGMGRAPVRESASPRPSALEMLGGGK
jgi:hypothetical protein